MPSDDLSARHDRGDRHARRARGHRHRARFRARACRGLRAAVLGKLPQPRLATLRRVSRPRSGETIDEGLALYFPAPHSYTGEPVLELQGHGGPVVMQALLAACLDAGARLAEPGEFTRRAFLEGKLDLAQAEAVADLIDAASREAARSALRSLSGEFSRGDRRARRRSWSSCARSPRRCSISRRRKSTRCIAKTPRRASAQLRAGARRGARQEPAGQPAAQRHPRRARRPPERRQVEPAQPAGGRGARDRHADPRHHARCAARADPDRGRAAGRGRYRGAARIARRDRAPRHASARSASSSAPIWCIAVFEASRGRR